MIGREIEVIVEPTFLEYLHRKFILAVASNAGSSDAEVMKKALRRGGYRLFFPLLLYRERT